MAELIEAPSIIEACGNKVKIIKEFIGNVNSSTEQVSVAKMESPQGWEEPGQTPKFNEYTVVLKGTLKVETKKEIIEVKAGQALIVEKGEWVRYSSPYEGGSEYIAICLPAFSPSLVNRDQ